MDESVDTVGTGRDRRTLSERDMRADGTGYSTYFGDDYWRLVELTCAAPAVLDAELGFLAPVIEHFQVRDVLDACCGRGRHVLALTGRGMAVTGVDVNPDAIHVAEARLQAEGLEATLRCSDIRSLDDASAYDMAIFMQTSFGYHSDDDNLDVLRHVYYSLRPGGCLVLDLPNRDDVVANFQRREWAQVEDTYYVIGHQFDYHEGARITELTAVDSLGIRQYDHRLRLYTLPELRLILEAAGYRLLRIVGDFTNDQTRFRRDFRRLQIVAVRP